MTTISFDIPGEAGRNQHATLTVHDIRGRYVKTLIDSELEPGRRHVVWDGTNDRGMRVTSGVYLYTLRCDTGSSTRKMVLVK
jgi:flagellar hook assembly protein FlgD